MALLLGCCWLVTAQARSVATGRPDVDVDTTVLDQLGPPSTLPGLLLQQNPQPTPSPGEKIRLIPPKSWRAPPPAHGRGNPASDKSPPLAAGTPDDGVIHLHRITPPPASGKSARPVAKAHAAAAPPAKPALRRTASAAPDKAPAVASPAPSLPAAAAPVAPMPAAAVPTAPSSAPPVAPAAPAGPPPATAAAGPMLLTPAPAAAGQRLAALTAQPAAVEGPAATAPESLSSISFAKESARLPDDARDTLAHLASRMTDDAGLEVQLLAYAAGDEENASRARRLSLSRALAVSSFLIDQGVRSTRIVVRALGNKVPDGAPDRVDIAVQKRG